METKKDFLSYLNSISLFLLGLLFLAFPLVITTINTDFFVLPKQIFLGAVVVISLFILALKMITEASVKLRRTIFDLPIIIFTFCVFLSTVFAVNRFDSLIAFVPFLFAILLFFIIVNTALDKNSLLFLIASLVASGALVSIISLLSFFKIYLLPFAITHTQTFTPLGSLLDQAVYLALLLPIAVVMATRHLKEKQSQINGVAESAEPQQNRADLAARVGFAIVSIIILIGLSITIYQLFNPTAGSGQSIILPPDTGFQTAFAAISQDPQRLIQNFLFGGGFGTYATAFTRFKSVAFNQNQTLWALTFFRSSSFVLELLTTTGILGLLSFIFLIATTIKELGGMKIRGKNPFFLSLILSLISLFVLPVSFPIQALFFMLLCLYAALQGLKNEERNRFFDIEFQLVALRKGVIAFAPTDGRSNKSRILPLIFGFIIIITISVLGFFSIPYVMADVTFQDSIVAASKNNGTETYQKQAKAIAIFPYRDAYYRVFSQTNLALANSLANQQPKTGSPNQQTQQTIYTLIQQSINAGRSATAIAPQTSLNWQNLSSIYRSLIGFGQNAENFAIATQQQAVALDPNNPQEYIILGGIYYQLGLWDNAQNQFQIAINLKPDFANGHYNLGHALENKGDSPNALTQFQTVKSLVSNDKNSLNLITQEIEALQKKIEEKGSPTAAAIPPSTIPPLNLSTPSSQLPRQNPPVKIPPPTTATTSGR